MLINFFLNLRKHRVPVTIRELMDLLESLKQGVVFANLDSFYFLSRACLVKDEKHYDRFDRAFGSYFRGLDDLHGMLESLVPDEWLLREIERSLSPEDLEEIKSLGGLELLIERFREERGEAERVAQRAELYRVRQEREPERVRMKGDEKTLGNMNHSARRVWDRRQYRSLDESVELGTRNTRMALRRLRQFARSGRELELDLDGTIHATSVNGGLLDIKMRPERRNAVKALVFFDTGGSMNPHIKSCEELFSAIRAEFRHLETYYFHNFIYEWVWRHNRRRLSERIPTRQILNSYASDYRVVFVGDGTMAPQEISHIGGCLEQWNEEPGAVWMARVARSFQKLIWINPTPQETWLYSPSVNMIQQMVDGRMFALTPRGIEEGAAILAR